MNLLKKLFGTKQKNHFDSIHNLPVYNWFKCRDNQDLSYLLKDESKHGSTEGVDFEELHSVYLDIITEFFTEFGQTTGLKKEVKLISKIVDSNILFIKTGDRFLLNNIYVMEERLRVMKLDAIDKSLKIDTKKESKKDIATVGSSIGGFVDTKKVVVSQFYTQLIGINESRKAA
jgi:hypothetical protein